MTFQEFFCAGVQVQPFERTAGQKVNEVPRCPVCGLHPAKGQYMDQQCATCARSERANMVGKLRRKGLTYQAIAVRMGVSKPRAWKLHREYMANRRKASR